MAVRGQGGPAWGQPAQAPHRRPIAPHNRPELLLNWTNNKSSADNWQLQDVISLLAFFKRYVLRPAQPCIAGNAQSGNSL
jgi:hypothetical protein